jgi:TolA-binding protein
MTITEFARARNVQAQTISIYIKRHEKLFKGHTSKAGKTIELDEVALKILDEKYPLPKPVEIIEDTESREKLIKAQELIIQLQDKLNQAQSKIAQAEATQLLLEDRTIQLKKADERIEKIEAESQELKNEIKELTDKSNEQVAEIERLKSRGLIARIFNS